MDYPRASMCTPASILKAPPRVSKEEKKELPPASKAKILNSTFKFYLWNVDKINKALKHYPTTIYKRNWPLNYSYQ